jgi:predicted cobalt transporter CbtA
VRFAFRLALVPVIVAVGVEEAWRKGLLWPIATTFARLVMPQPDTAESEADPIG